MTDLDALERRYRHDPSTEAEPILALIAEHRAVLAATDTLSQRCGFPIVLDRVQVLDTIGRMVERQQADIAHLTQRAAELEQVVGHAIRWFDGERGEGQSPYNALAAAIATPQAQP